LFRGSSSRKRGAALLEGVVTRASVCLRRVGENRAAEVRFGRFLANEKVTVERLIAGWSDHTGSAVAGRHVLAIQDTSEVNFSTTARRRRGLGEIGKGSGRGLLVHPLLAIDAKRDTCLGLAGGEIWTRTGRVKVPHQQRPLAEKESRRWVSTAERSKAVLAGAAMVTMVADCEADFYAEWAILPDPAYHLLIRAYNDRPLTTGGKLFATVSGYMVADTATLELRDRGPQQPARTARLELRYGAVTIKRPVRERTLPASVALRFVEVVEPLPPPGVEPLRWLLLTTHPVENTADAWRIAHWYKKRWIIEQLFRVLKTQGLKLEDSQLDTADRLLKLAAIATKAAVLTIQLIQARDGISDEPASLAFHDEEVATLDALNSRVQGKTALQKNPHRQRSLAWATWIIARLGGWDGYPKKKPGPITIRHGIERFFSIVEGWRLRDVCIP
jgi:hypothetical protein